ncbi:MAG: hypothetical protein ABIL16_03445 [candidate division WOR-3 bacterium]
MMWIIAVDTIMPVFRMKPIVVMGENGKVSIEAEIGKDGTIGALKDLGITPVTRGSFITSDINFFGFKGKDINISVDGERFSNACPNRMDVPLIRINPIEVKNVIVYPTSSLGSALGGEIRVIRRRPSENPSLMGYLGLNTLSSTGGEVSTAFEGYNHGLYLRFSRMNTYKDGDGRDFQNLYGYKPDVKFAHTFYEGSLMGSLRSLSYNVGIWYYKDVLYPYLMMDERDSKTISLGLSYNGNKLYANFTDHTMDNGLRNEMMYMLANAKRYKFGIVGQNYDIYYDRWYAESEMHHMKQTVMPNFSSYNAAFGHQFNTGYINIYAKLGLQYFKTDVNKGRVFIPFALRPSYSILSFEVSSSAPDPKELYFSRPSFFGNPDLKQPIKFSLYLNPSYKFINLLLFSHIVKDYVEVVGKVLDGKKITTFENTDALLIGFNIKIATGYIDITSNYTYGKNLRINDYLSEIPPLSVSIKLKTPEFLKSKGFIRFNYNDAQIRVSKSINEKPTTSWKTVDLGYELGIKNLSISLVLENILNETYYTHLSYYRDPFMSGKRVYEPGRMLKISITSGF